MFALIASLAFAAPQHPGRRGRIRRGLLDQPRGRGRNRLIVTGTSPDEQEMLSSTAARPTSRGARRPGRKS